MTYQQEHFRGDNMKEIPNLGDKEGLLYCFMKKSNKEYMT